MWRAVTTMDFSKEPRKKAIATKCTRHARTRQHVAIDVTDRRNGCSEQHEQLSATAEHNLRRRGQRRFRVGRKLGAQYSLRDDLQGDVQNGHNRKRGEDRSGYGSRGVGDLPARSER